MPFHIRAQYIAVPSPTSVDLSSLPTPCVSIKESTTRQFEGIAAFGAPTHPLDSKKETHPGQLQDGLRFQESEIDQSLLAPPKPGSFSRLARACRMRSRSA